MLGEMKWFKVYFFLLALPSSHQKLSVKSVEYFASQMDSNVWALAWWFCILPVWIFKRIFFKKIMQTLLMTLSPHLIMRPSIQTEITMHRLQKKIKNWELQWWLVDVCKLPLERSNAEFLFTKSFNNEISSGVRCFNRFSMSQTRKLLSHGKADADDWKLLSFLNVSLHLESVDCNANKSFRSTSDGMRWEMTQKLSKNDKSFKCGTEGDKQKLISNRTGYINLNIHIFIFFFGFSYRRRWKAWAFIKSIFYCCQTCRFYSFNSGNGNHKKYFRKCELTWNFSFVWF